MEDIFIIVFYFHFSSHQGTVEQQNDGTQNEKCEKAQMQCDTPPRCPIHGLMAIMILENVALKYAFLSEI